MPCRSACGLVAIMSALHTEARQFDPGKVHHSPVPDFALLGPSWELLVENPIWNSRLRIPACNSYWKTPNGNAHPRIPILTSLWTSVKRACMPGVEPGPRAWKACVMLLRYMRF